jgi:pimeloyl-ACP methyl ester carboxylesterase
MSAEPTFVLVPGGGGDAWDWHLVIAELERRGRDAVAVALPGPDPDAGIHEYADLVVEAARGLDDVVLVAHSLGGFTAPLACPRLPVSSLVFVNAMIPALGETAGDWWANVGSEQAMREADVRAGRDPDTYDMTARFMHDVPADLATASAQRNPDESEAVFASVFDLPAWPEVPTRVLVGTDEQFFPVELQQRVARERLGVEPELIPGGHYVAISRPIELVDALLR